MSPLLVQLYRIGYSFPRSRGDEPKIPINKLLYREFSPLTRG